MALGETSGVMQIETIKQHRLYRHAADEFQTLQIQGLIVRDHFTSTSRLPTEHQFQNLCFFREFWLRTISQTNSERQSGYKKPSLWISGKRRDRRNACQ
jgi:hypothetical protein